MCVCVCHSRNVVACPTSTLLQPTAQRGSTLHCVMCVGVCVRVCVPSVTHPFPSHDKGGPLGRRRGAFSRTVCGCRFLIILCVFLLVIVKACFFSPPPRRPWLALTESRRQGGVDVGVAVAVLYSVLEPCGGCFCGCLFLFLYFVFFPRIKIGDVCFFFSILL